MLASYRVYDVGKKEKEALYMQIRLNEKQCREEFIGILPLGYCDLYYTLKAYGRVGYTCGVYGWNSDVYDLKNGYAISCGYRPFGNMRKPEGIVEKYEKKERQIMKRDYANWQNRDKALLRNFDKFVKEIMDYNKA